MNDKQPVFFPGWKSALSLSNLPPVVKSSHTRPILTVPASSQEDPVARDGGFNQAMAGHSRAGAKWTCAPCLAVILSDCFKAREHAGKGQEKRSGGGN